MRRKYLSMMLILVLILGLLTPAAGPVHVQAADAQASITVGEAIEMNNDGSEQTVAGYIVGYVISPGNVSDNDFREDHNVALADEAGESDPENMLRSEEHTSELQSRGHLVCRLLLEKKKHTLTHIKYTDSIK